MTNLILLTGDNEQELSEYEAALKPLGLASTTICGTAGNIPPFASRLTPFGAICRFQSPPEALTRTQQLVNLFPRIAVLLVTRDGGENFSEAAWSSGAAGLFYLPVNPEVVAYGLRSASAPFPETSDNLVGHCKEMRITRSLLSKIAAADCNVLISGETGTGKELAAAAIHQSSSRKNHPFQCVNCAAIPDSLLESELFGYEKGAFTGANFRSLGQLRTADGGIVFLDEIGEMSLFAQAKLLRVIETKQVYPLGAGRSTSVDVRVIAATNRDLDQLVSEGRFRDDLFFRLKIAHVQMTALRNRRDDIGLLVRHFVRQLNLLYRRHVRGLTDDALDCLKAYPWPGNVRELKNLIESIFVLQPGTFITPNDLPAHVRSYASVKMRGSEVDQLQEALAAMHWNKSKAASMLCWSRMTVYRKIAKYGIKPPQAHTAGGGTP